MKLPISLATLYFSFTSIGLTEGFTSQYPILRRSVENLLSSSIHTDGPMFQTTTSTSLFMSSGGDFEYEELKAQMGAMQKQKLTSDNLTGEKRRELSSYVQGVLQKRMSPISLTEMDAFLAGTSWRLSYSTEGFAGTGLPKDATIELDFAANNLDATYSLTFGEKTFGIDKLTAASQWRCGNDLTAQDASRAGVVTLTYDKISTDMFGFNNIGVGFFGLLQGRSNYIQTVYFDGDVWIEEGYNPAGEQYYNVYVKQQ